MKFGVLIGAALGALALSAPASAVVVFDLGNVSLVDGGTLTGSLTVSDDLQTLVDFSFTTSSNHNWPYLNFTGRTYTMADATALTWNPTNGLWSQYGSPLAQVRIYLGEQLTSAGAVLSGDAGEWQASAGFRSVVNGALTPQATPGAVPEPAVWAMLIAGFGLVGVALRRRSGMVAASN